MIFKQNRSHGFAHLQLLIVGVFVLSVVAIAGIKVATAGYDISSATTAVSRKDEVKIRSIKVIYSKKAKGHQEGSRWCANVFVGFKVKTSGSVDWVAVHLVSKLNKRYYNDTSGNKDPITVPDYKNRGDYVPYNLTHRGNSVWGDDDGYSADTSNSDATNDNAYQTVKLCTDRRGKGVNASAYGYINAFGPGGYKEKNLPKKYIKIE